MGVVSPGEVGVRVRVRIAVVLKRRAVMSRGKMEGGVPRSDSAGAGWRGLGGSQDFLRLRLRTRCSAIRRCLRSLGAEEKCNPVLKGRNSVGASGHATGREAETAELVPE